MGILDCLLGKKQNRRESNLELKSFDSEYIGAVPVAMLREDRKIYQARPQFTPLTSEEIEAIHERGKITQEEKVEEWEKFDICAPGDGIGSASDRCRKFGYRCHDCLVDYSLANIEYDSFCDDFKLVNSVVESINEGKVDSKKRVRRK